MIRHELFFRLANMLGWEIKIISKKETCLHHADLADTLYCGTGKHWYTFCLPMSQTDKHSQKSLLSLYHYLLHLTDHMFMAKFALDAEHNLLLCAEIPVNGLQEALLYYCLEELKEYLEKYKSHIHCLEQLPALEPIHSGEMARGYKPGITPDIIKLWFKSLNNIEWYYDFKMREQTWHLYYKNLFHIYLTITPVWAYFQVPILNESISVLTVNSDPNLQLQFLEYLLHLNDVLYMAKFGLTHQDDVLLLLELPTEALNFSMFQLAIQALANYLDNYTQEVQIMATLDKDIHLVELLMQPHLSRADLEKNIG